MLQQVPASTDTSDMGSVKRAGMVSLSKGDHFSCSLSTALLKAIHHFGGEAAVERVLRESGCTRPVAYLEDAGNWLSFKEAIALLDAGQAITGDPHFARHLGEQAIPSVPGSAVVAMLRALGTPEEAYRRISAVAAKMNLVTDFEAKEVGPGHAEVVVTARPGFPLARQHCEWTYGLLTQPPLAFGLSPAVVEHVECVSAGASHCRYRISWAPAGADDEDCPTPLVTSLKAQVTSLTERLESLFATAADLVTSEDLELTLERITEQAGHQMRTPRCLLVLRATPRSEPRWHSLGFDEGDAAEIAAGLLSDDASTLPSSWLVAPVASRRRDHGCLVAMYDSDNHIIPQERLLLDAYARFAAAALDGATEVMEAESRHRQASTLLALARALAGAASSEEIAHRLVEALPQVVDCDRVAVFVWEEHAQELVRKAVTYRHPGDHELSEYTVRLEQLELLREYVEARRSGPLFVDPQDDDSDLAQMLAERGAVASVVVPVAIPERFLGAFAVSVTADPQRLRECPELLDQLSGVAAQAATALNNGRLVDQITHQASHDGLTGLINRAQFSEQLSRAVDQVGQEPGSLTVFYIDLDNFKPVNDQFGHAAGDELLCQVADRLRECVRSGDTVARLGGDEFAILAQHIRRPDEADRVARRLASAFREPFDVAGTLQQMAASIGRANWPVDAEEVDALIRRADAAMYAIKRSRAGELASR